MGDLSQEQERIRERIRAVMDGLGVQQNDLAERMGVAPAEVSRWLSTGKGARPINIERLKQFAAALDCNWKNLLDQIVVPVRGYVGAGERVFNFDESEPLDYVTPPDGAERTTALIVRGDSMLPRYEPGTLLFFFPTDTIGRECFGRTCIVQVKDGPTLVKKLKEGASPGRFRLISTRAPEIDDAEVLWAARVQWTKEP